MKKIIVIAIAVSTFAGSAAYAQSSSGTVNGAAGGAVTGAIVGGPVGAAVGGVAGAVVGTAIDPPPRRVITYVEQQPMPQSAVVVQEPVVVGRALPSDVVVTPIPDDPHYAYTVVGHQRVIVEPETHRVVQVLD